MSSKSQEVGHAVSHKIDQAEAGLHNAVSAGAEAARNGTNASARWAAEREASLTNRARHFSKGLQERATGLGNSMGDSLEMAAETAEETFAMADEYVKRKPWTAIGIAAGVAFVFGLYAGRR